MVNVLSLRPEPYATARADDHATDGVRSRIRPGTPSGALTRATATSGRPA
jgi:hypothetical protein